MSIEKRSRFFRIRSLKKCLVLSFILLICALFAIFFYYIFGIAARTKSWERKNFLELSELAAERLQGALADSQNVAVTLGYSAACQKFLLSENPNVVIEAKRTASDTISYARLYGNHFKDIVLLGVNERLISNTTSYREITELVLTMTGMGSMEERRFTDGFYAPVIVDRDSQYLVYVFPVYGNIDGYRYRRGAWKQPGAFRGGGRGDRTTFRRRKRGGDWQQAIFVVPSGDGKYRTGAVFFTAEPGGASAVFSDGKYAAAADYFIFNADIDSDGLDFKGTAS